MGVPMAEPAASAAAPTGTGLARRFEKGTLMPGTRLVPWLAFAEQIAVYPSASFPAIRRFPPRIDIICFERWRQKIPASPESFNRIRASSSDVGCLTGQLCSFALAVTNVMPCRLSHIYPKA